jgi:glycerol-3-phosphate dehydrogenase subunit B
MNYDVVVIGAGLGGLMAGITAAKEGKKVIIVGKGIGIITIFTGTIDYLGHYPPKVIHPLKSPREGIEALIAENPDHPYSKVGMKFIEEGVSAFKEAAESGGVKYVGDLERNYLLPTAVGTVKATSLLSSTMAAGDLRDDGDVLICGFQGLRDFYPAYMAHNISTLNVEGVELPHFRGRLVDLKLGAESSGMTSLTLARKFDDPDFLEGVAEALYENVRDGERIATPAVLGLRRSDEVIGYIERVINTKVFETPTLPPSVSGYRLYKALEAVVRSLGVKLLLGYEVVSARVEKGKVLDITIKMGKREMKIDGKAFVLAAGGLVGRGISSTESNLAEPIFGLDVTGPKKRSEWFNKSFFDPDGHPINKVGIGVDENLMPVMDKKKPQLKNLFVAGAQLSGYDALKEKSGGGVTISSSYKAGVMASNV